ncbi:uncharacterized protein LOC126835827 [Adelges cooleyi]|uniref:uncharacterized protein LOC126835827 n=1 Tax=Adelges cooleyi TaxID=133065 RepID=UPI0021807C87|nr:uncharacterized protein LOC126835827 [Adelges cooleyi]
MQSQRWVFTSPGGEDEYKKPSVTREHYTAAVVRQKESANEIDRKRRDLEQFMWRTMTDRVLNEMNEKRQTAAEYGRPACQTSYCESYGTTGFRVKELGTEIDQELESKYPLYTDTAKSVHLREIEKTKKKEAIHKPLSDVFKRDSRFTSRLSNPQDTHALAPPGHYAYV